MWHQRRYWSDRTETQQEKQMIQSAGQVRSQAARQWVNRWSPTHQHRARWPNSQWEGGCHPKPKTAKTTSRPDQRRC